MSGSRKLLIVGGLALVLWGMGYGLFYAVFVEHQTLDQLGGSLTTGFARAAERKMPEAEAALDAYAEGNFAYVRQVDVHSHWIGLGMLLIVLGIAFERVPFDERRRFYLALALLVGATVFPLGVMLETMNRGAGPKAVAVVGSGLIVVALAAASLGFARAGESQ
jgi:hypothetical protein